MVIALLAPEVVLYLAIIERIEATYLMKKALEFHPRLAKPGMLVRVYQSIRATWKNVSVPYQTSMI